MSLTPSKHGRRSRVKRVPLPKPESPFYDLIAGNRELRGAAFIVARAATSENVRAMQRAIALAQVDQHLRLEPTEQGYMTRRSFFVPTLGDVLDVVREIEERIEPTDALVISIKPYLSAG